MKSDNIIDIYSFISDIYSDFFVTKTYWFWFVNIYIWVVNLFIMIYDLMSKFFDTLNRIWSNDSLKKKIMFTLLMILLYRLLVYIPVPFVNIDNLNAARFGSSGLQYFAMLLGGSFDRFSIIAVWLTPYINASIITQLLANIIPSWEELSNEWEAGQKKIQQYTRYITFPLAILQSIGMTYLINSQFGGNIIDVTQFFPNVMGTAIVLSFGSILLMWMAELITEKWIGNGTSMIIFANIVSGIVTNLYSSIIWADNKFILFIAVFILILMLIILAVFIIKTVKEIPVLYSRQGKVQQTSTLPFPLNPVGMVPIIFAIAFVSFPYLATQILIKFGTNHARVEWLASWIEKNFNFYNTNHSRQLTLSYFLLIVFFTFFYTLIQFNPEKIADNIQSRWWFIPSVRPGKETVNYINKILMHLCLRGGSILWFLGIYSTLLNYIPALHDIMSKLWSIPIAITGSGIIIIVWVVQDIMNKINSELVMTKYN